MDYLQQGSIVGDKSHIDNMLNNVNPYAPPVFVSKGTMQTTLGGRTTFRDINGGTLLTYDPKTGTITIFGGLVSQQNVNVGTLSNSTFTGTIMNTGLINGGTFEGMVKNSTIQASSLSQGTLTSPIIHGTTTFDILSGSIQLGIDGQFALQTKGTSVILSARLGGTTFFFSPQGTLT